jgi:hypothetical protein
MLEESETRKTDEKRWLTTNRRFPDGHVGWWLGHYKKARCVNEGVIEVFVGLCSRLGGSRNGLEKNRIGEE